MIGKPCFFSLLIITLVSTQLYFKDTQAEMLNAPFDSNIAMRQFSEDLMTLLGTGELARAQQSAVGNSHLDDPVAQENLNEAFDMLAKKLAGAPKLAVNYVQTSKFGRSFLRHQYTLAAPDFAMRCMMTYRRKTDGWRLNQLWCH